MDDPGELFVVATPLGNLEDVTLRALRVLGEASVVLAEDTRTTRRLLSAHGIRTPLVSLHEHNERERIPAVLARLAAGERVALVSDAGTPGVSDPGYHVVRAAAEDGFAVHPVPGPSAAVAALSASGLATDSFLFVGFLPKKAGKRAAKIAQIASVPATLVFYESPRRVAALAAELAAALGPREAVLAREVTKLHEEFVRLPLDELARELEAREEVRGECTLLVAGAGEDAPAAPADAEELVREGLREGGLSASKLAARVARETNLPKNEVYGMVLRLRGE